MSLPKSNHNFKSNVFLENYTPDENLRPVHEIVPPVIISNPIIVEKTVKPNFVLYEQVLQAIDTVVDGDLITLNTFNKIPLVNSNIVLSVNGVEVVPENSIATSAFYVTDSTGTIFRTPSTYQVGDQFHWNGSLAGMQIESTDHLVLLYEIAGP